MWAVVGLFLERVEPPGDVFGGSRAFVCISGYTRAEDSGDRRLFDHFTIIATVQTGENAADRTCVLGQLAQVGI